MEQPLRLNMISVTVDQSRTNRIYTIQELLLEYSLFIIVLGCFMLISLSSKVVQEFGGSKGEASPLVYRSQWGWTLHGRHFISRKPERVQVHRLYVKAGNSGYSNHWRTLHLQRKSVSHVNRESLKPWLRHVHLLFGFNDIDYYIDWEQYDNVSFLI